MFVILPLAVNVCAHSVLWWIGNSIHQMNEWVSKSQFEFHRFWPVSLYIQYNVTDRAESDIKGNS